MKNTARQFPIDGLWSLQKKERKIQNKSACQVTYLVVTNGKVIKFQMLSDTERTQTSSVRDTNGKTVLSFHRWFVFITGQCKISVLKIHKGCIWNPFICLSSVFLRCQSLYYLNALTE